ncbi:hypothetical protein [Halalkalibacter okhensis]|uniref:Uncharacterized protein n=1 Tax=Halalkalibacter okhensis TaxID=333138 RepID=A0A0B0IE79_9BACI|nr:hypothetical protein [Halalkalibacter okhensis]KHF37976.1 hypothetical protein LQ50_24220 [Halalkalibacter okhensis]
MIVFFSVKMGMIFLIIGWIGSFFLKDKWKLSIVLDVISVGAGRMQSGERINGILALLAGAALVFLMQFFAGLYNMGIYGSIVSMIVFLIFTFQVALRYEQRQRVVEVETDVSPTSNPSIYVFDESKYELYKQQRKHQHEKLKNMSIEEVLENRRKQAKADWFMEPRTQEEVEEVFNKKEFERVEDERMERDRIHEEQEKMERQNEEEEWRSLEEESNRLFNEQQEEYDRERYY